MKLFVVDTLGKLGENVSDEDKAFEEAFLEFDKDGSGFISKGEIIHFIKKMLREGET